MEKKIMNQPQSEKAVQNNKGFSAFNTYNDLREWTKYVKNYNSLIHADSKLIDNLNILSDVVDNLIKKVETLDNVLTNNYVTLQYDGTTK